MPFSNQKADKLSVGRGGHSKQRSSSKSPRPPRGRASISVDTESAGPTVNRAHRADSDDKQAVKHRERSQSQAQELKAEFAALLDRFEHDKNEWAEREKEIIDYTNKLKKIKQEKMDDHSSKMPHTHKSKKQRRSQAAKGKDDMPSTSAVDVAAMRGGRSPSELIVETFKNAADENEQLKNESGSDAEQVDKDGQPLTDSIRFFAGNPCVEKTTGILHLYRYNGSLVPPSQPGHLDDMKSKTLCLLAVPAWVTCRELLQFLARVSADIRSLRIIRDSSPNRYMALVTFRSQSSADEFYSHYNGTQYNSIEPDICSLVYVKRVELTREQSSLLQKQNPNADSSSARGSPSDCTELPTCPVCLERMDESVDGILTILCTHAFHGRCLSQWSDPTCPVCRQCQTPELQADQSCAVCGRNDDLWICLICGHVGCGRYAMGHAQGHFRTTMHTFSLQVGGSRVWDYAGDNYVHRLLLSKEDGKLVEYEPASRDANASSRRSAVGAVPNENADDVPCDDKTTRRSFDEQDECYLEQRESLQLEFTKLLSTQLESQRKYFEEKLLTVEKLAAAQLEDVERQVSSLTTECVELRHAVAKLEMERNQLDKKHAQCGTKLKQLTAERDEERQMNSCLRADHEKWKRQVDELNVKLEVQKRTSEITITDLREQVRDLMFHFEAESKLRDAAQVQAQAEHEQVHEEGDTPSSTSASPMKKKGSNAGPEVGVTQEDLMSAHVGVVPSPARRHKKKK